MDKNIKVIYNKLKNIKSNQGFVDLRNFSIKSQTDMVDICNIFRDFRYETFRIFYMKDNKIIAQESITSRIPDAVIIFNEKTGNPIRIYEKMINRMERLNSDGYYLAHNHCSETAKPSLADIEITRNFSTNVEGFLGHIIVGGVNKYSIIEKDTEGRIVTTEERTLSEHALESIEEKLIDNSFYNMKITSREELVALFMKMQDEKNFSSVILTDTKANIRMVLDIPNKMLNQNTENLSGFLKNLGRKVGATRAFIGTHDQKTYFKIIEHQRYGIFKDIVYIDNHNQIITPEIDRNADLFDKEKKKKSYKNRNAR